MIQIKVREKCSDCEKGFIYDPHCTTCGRRIPEDDPFWKSNSDTLPCGHSYRECLVEEYDCPTCEGTGWIEGWADPNQVFDACRRASQLLQADLAMVHDLNRTQAQEIEKLLQRK